MNCIFCHKDSSTSKSKEHIIPESLGNKSHTLPKGYVCDECNNYFARKIEKELLEQPYFISLRHRNEICTKKGKPVPLEMFFPGAMKSADVIMETSEKGLIYSFNDEEVYESIIADKSHIMIAPYLPMPECPNHIMSRFLAKCAFEYFLYNVGEKHYNECVQFLCEKQFDPIRLYARYGEGKEWQYNQRRIYSEGTLLVDKEYPYEVLHEMKFLINNFTSEGNGYSSAEIYYVLCLNGVEYCINFSDLDISGYKQWLDENDQRSPLEDDNETKLPFELSDVNPLLIKK